MSIKTSLHSARRHIVKAFAATALTLACSFHTEPAKAGLPVIDYTAIINSLKNYYDQYGRWIQTTQHYAETVQHYAQTAAFWQTQFNKLQHLNFTLFALKHTFTEVDSDFGADVECPGRVASSGVAGVLDKALSTLIPDMNGDVVQQQQNICVLIVEAKNDKYNDTVRYLNFIQTKGAELAKTQGLADATKGEMGSIAGLTSQIGEFGQTLESARTNWETNQKQIDAQIDMLLTMQANLSRRAMKGSPNIIGTVVNAAAMKAAFD
jgi:hypothetical protein